MDADWCLTCDQLIGESRHASVFCSLDCFAASLGSTGAATDSDDVGYISPTLSINVKLRSPAPRYAALTAGVSLARVTSCCGGRSDGASGSTSGTSDACSEAESTLATSPSGEDSDVSHLSQSASRSQRPSSLFFPGTFCRSVSARRAFALPSGLRRSSHPMSASAARAQSPVSCASTSLGVDADVDVENYDMVRKSSSRQSRKSPVSSRVLRRSLGSHESVASLGHHTLTLGNACPGVLRRVDSGQKTPTRVLGKSVWNMAELSLDDGSDGDVPEPWAESDAVDDASEQRGRGRQVAHRVHTGRSQSRR